MENLAAVVPSILTPILTGLIVWWIERKKAKDDEQKEQARQINAEVNAATMELAYASAMALKRGETNGEVEAAVAAYKKAKKHMDEFNLKRRL